jgi:hypothetical protein
VHVNKRRKNHHNRQNFTLNTKSLILYKNTQINKEGIIEIGGKTDAKGDTDATNLLNRILMAGWYFEKNKKEIDNKGFLKVIVPFKMQDKKWKITNKFFIIKCSVCNQYFTRFTRRSVTCDDCTLEHKKESQKVRSMRARGLNIRYCQNPFCGKSLSTAYPNKKYCDRACQQAAYRERKRVMLPDSGAGR